MKWKKNIHFDEEKGNEMKKQMSELKWKHKCHSVSGRKNQMKWKKTYISVKKKEMKLKHKCVSSNENIKCHSVLGRNKEMKWKKHTFLWGKRKGNEKTNVWAKWKLNKYHSGRKKREWNEKTYISVRKKKKKQKTNEMKKTELK